MQFGQEEGNGDVVIRSRQAWQRENRSARIVMETTTTSLTRDSRKKSAARCWHVKPSVQWRKSMEQIMCNKESTVVY